jgi:hypothetical protein
MSDAAWGQVLTAGLLLILLVVLARLKPRTSANYLLPGGSGPLLGGLIAVGSFLYGLILGKDNRTSTSQCVALAWTFVVAYLLVSLLAAKWFGDDTGWTALPAEDLAAYLVFLGGPYAAGILAKAAAVSAASKGTKTTSTAPASIGQVVTDDSGQTDLGDLQYVLFNAIAIVFVIVSFAGHLDRGLPVIPTVLWALALTSASGYTAKKLITDPLPVVRVTTNVAIRSSVSRAAAAGALGPRRPE